MMKTKWTKLATAAAMLMFSTAAAQATTLRAFVSSTGNDANAATNCAQTAPCRTFAAAFPTVTPGGELIALDSAGYGPLTNIDKAITIAAVPGATAFVIVATGTSGFTINGGAGDSIVLRNISFNGTSAANTTGITHNTGKLVIENCEITQTTIAGLRGFAGTIIAQHTSFSGNLGRGVHVSGTAKADMVDVLIANNGTGLTANGSCQSTFVRIDSGSVLNNTLGFEMLNGVCAPNQGSLPPNIFLRGDGGVRVNVIGNTTVVGPSTGFGSVVVVGVYSSITSTAYPPGP